MSHPLPFVFCLLLGLCAFLLGRWVGSRGRRWALAGAGSMLAVLIAKSALAWLPLWEATLFPWLGYAFLQGWWLFPIALAFFGLCLPQLPIAWNRWAVVGIAGLLWGYSVWSTRWMVDPRAIGADQGADVLHHCRQSTPFTCAPAACTAALSYLGIATSERAMAERCLTRADDEALSFGPGTNVFNIYRGLGLALEGSPWRARVTALDPAALAADGALAVISTHDGRHAIAVRGLGGVIAVHDPLLPHPLRWSVADLADRASGPVVLIERRP